MTYKHKIIGLFLFGVLLGATEEDTKILQGVTRPFEIFYAKIMRLSEGEACLRREAEAARRDPLKEFREETELLRKKIDEERREQVDDYNKAKGIDPSEVYVQPSTFLLETVADGNAFATDLYAQVNDNKTKNLFLSPIGVYTALSMLYAGAADQTSQELNKALHISGTNDLFHAIGMDEFINRINNKNRTSYELKLANALWLQKGRQFQDTYLNQVQSNYQAQLQVLDFSNPKDSSDTINKWAADNTNNKITKVIEPKDLKIDTGLVLTNAIYFKGKWDNPFKKTDNENFAVATNKTIKTPMMSNGEYKKLQYFEDDVLQALSIPYVKDLSMVVFLPRKKNGLYKVEQILTSKNIASWIFGMEERNVDVHLPKFNFTDSFELNKPLEKLGITQAFDERRANFSKLSDKNDLFLSKVLHKSFIAVDEQGTEAVAVTSTRMVQQSAAPRPKPPVVFRADHPFVFIIYDNATRGILFMGRVADPSQGA